MKIAAVLRGPTMKSKLLFLFVTITLALILQTPNFSHAAKRGGSVTYNLGAEPQTLNPITSQDTYARVVQGYVLEELLTRDISTYEWKPNLAEKWEISKDGKIFTFFLRPTAKWSDGTPVTLEDVKFSFDVIFDDKFSTAHMRPYYEQIEKVEVTAPNIIKFYTKSKYFLNFDVAAGLTILPKKMYGDPNAKNLNKELLGSGPYKIAQYDKGTRLVLDRNPNWWGDEMAKKDGEHNFDKIVLRFVKEEDVALEMLKKGDLDFDDFNSEVFNKKAVGPEWGKKVFKMKVENSSPKGYGFIGWNLQNDLFKDKKVRIALNHLYNRELINEKFNYNMSDFATGPTYIQSEYASKAVKPILFDLPKALKLFKEAGWEDKDKNGILEKEIGGKKVDFKFTLLTANQDTMKYLTIFKEDAKKAGVEIELKVVEWNTFLKLLDDKQFDALALGWSTGVEWDPKQIWHSSSSVKGGSNFTNYSNPEVDKLIDQAREELDKKKRIPILKKVYELIAADAPYLWFFNAKYVFYGHSPRMKRNKDTLKYGIGTSFWWAE